MDAILQAAPEIAAYLRDLSPLWEDRISGNAIASGSMAAEPVRGGPLSGTLKRTKKAVTEAQAACPPTSSAALFWRRGPSWRGEDCYDRQGSPVT